MKLTALEAAAAIALGGSVLAVAVPTFVRNLSSSRLAEATQGVATLGTHAVAFAADRPCADGFPPTAPLTPTSVPRGAPVVDADPDPWLAPTWRALDFRPSPPGVPHSFSFAFDTSHPRREDSDFVAAAHGDLDGDGVLSTFEVRGTCRHDTAALVPGMYVEAELE
jgi:hypothetical protein